MKHIFAAAQVLTLLLLTALATTGSAYAYGELDPSYSAETLAGASCRTAQAVLPDGGIFTAVDLGIARHSADGKIDRTWGVAGIAQLPASMHLQQLLPAPDGGLFAVGWTGGNIVAKYTPDGTLNKTFGIAGIAELGPQRYYSDAALQADGSVVVGASYGYQFVRINRIGVRDRSFGSDGFFTLPTGAIPNNANIYAWSVAADGSMQVAWVQNLDAPGDVPRPMVTRFRKDASIADPDADSAGRLVPRQGVADWISPTAKVLADGALLLATQECLDSSCAEVGTAVRRFDARGKADASFGNDGRAAFPLFPGLANKYGSEKPGSMWLGPNGQITIVIHGRLENFIFLGVGGNPIFATYVYHLNANGSLDATIENGKKLADYDYATFLQMDDGRLLLPGTVTGVNGGCAPQKYLTGTPRSAAIAVEYYSPFLDRYFITAHEFEKVFVDTGMAGDWRRTGQSFGAFSIDAPIPGTVPVCRFYSGTNGGPVSHFYSAEKFECDILARMEAETPADKPAWRFERDAFRIAVPVAGICAANLTPLYRIYNNGAAVGKGSNHRYTSDPAIVAEMQSKGWISEGVRMCMPPAGRSDRTPELF